METVHTEFVKNGNRPFLQQLHTSADYTESIVVNLEKYLKYYIKKAKSAKQAKSVKKKPIPALGRGRN